MVNFWDRVASFIIGPVRGVVNGDILLMAPSRGQSHIPPLEVRKIIDSKVPAIVWDMLIPWRVSIKKFSRTANKFLLKLLT